MLYKTASSSDDGHRALRISGKVIVKLLSCKVNDLLVISYLVLERGVWSLPSS